MPEPTTPDRNCAVCAGKGRVATPLTSSLEMDHARGYDSPYWPCRACNGTGLDPSAERPQSTEDTVNSSLREAVQAAHPLYVAYRREEAAAAQAEAAVYARFVETEIAVCNSDIALLLTGEIDAAAVRLRSIATQQANVEWGHAHARSLSAREQSAWAFKLLSQAIAALGDKP